MDKELDAFEKIKKSHYVDGRLPLIDKVRFDIIEQELKDHKEIKEIMRNHHCEDRFELNCKLCDYEEMLFDSEEHEKKGKALEIIRNHSDLTTLEIKKRPAYTEYLLVIGSLGKKVITKEEYDLLKEVLL